MTTIDPLVRGREAYEQLAWRDAYDHLSAADQQDALDAADLDRLARAVGHPCSAVRPVHHAGLEHAFR